MPILERTILAALMAVSGAAARAEESQNPFARIGHIVIVFTENRSFDHVFGAYPDPRVEGLSSPGAKIPQVDRDGSILSQLPFPFHDPRIPAPLPNAPFALDAVLKDAPEKIDPTHEFYQEQEQINGGRMDRFVETSNAGGLVMGYFGKDSGLEQWKLAKEFTLADHFFHAAYGGSMLNHFYLICACAPRYPNPPADLTPLLDADGRLARFETSPASAMAGAPKWRRSGKVTFDGYAYGKFLPFAPIAPGEARPPDEILPMQLAPTIGEALDEKGVSWAWYAGGWDDAVSGRARPYREPDYFQIHHQPFAYFQAYAPGAKAREEHLRDEAEFLKAAKDGNLPEVTFYKPIGRLNGHPKYSRYNDSDRKIAEIVAALRASPNWKDMLVIIAADENGGYWDHVAPPEIDRFGPGARVPALIVSPFARKGFVDKTVYDTTSILRTIETRFGLRPLGERDARANDFRNALEFTQ